MTSRQWYLQSQRARQKSSPCLAYCPQPQGPVLTRSTARRFLFTLAAVSVVLNKVLFVLLDSLDFWSLSTYVWLPSVFVLDACFLAIVYYGLQCSRNVILLLITTTVVLFTTLVVSLNVTAMLGHHSTVPWTMTVWVLSEWQHFHMIAKAKASESLIKVWMVVLVEVLWTCIIMSVFSRWRKTSLPRHYYFSSTRRVHLQRLVLASIYLFLIMSFRPHVPYKKLSQTPCFSVPIEIQKGLKDYQRHKRLATYGQQRGTTRPRQVPTTISNSTANNDMSHLNVVIIFLESVRADMMPFDPTTAWAKRFVPDPKVDITPFYSNFTKSNDTLYIPLIKSASGLTHKSLLSTLCSMMALPIQGTTEPFSNLYHACLPQLLAQYYNYTSIFVQPQTEEFEHQRDLIQRLGFPHFFGKESYDEKFQPSDDFVKLHTANYFGYEDNVMLPVLMNWVDEQTQTSRPFLLSYLCGITHDPHTIPPMVNWAHQNFSPNKRVNEYLNTVSYMDHWLKLLMGEFERRKLLESTLFVILGDHGGNFYDHGSDFGAFDSKYEEGTDVGVSFYSQSAQWKELLKTSRPSVNNGNYTSIDVVPTILEVLGIGDDRVRSGKYNNSWVDGQSMLHSSGQRLRLTIPNPGYTMVLRDRSYVLMRHQYDTPEAFDLNEDPEQKNPLLIESSMSLESPLASWGEKAVQFLQFLEEDLHYSYGAGERCSNCTLSFLLTNETLDEWNPDMAPRRSWYGQGDDAFDWDTDMEPYYSEDEYSNE